MPSHAVHWHEGMFLRPQHLQAADREARERLEESEDWYHAYNWGLRRVDLDERAVGNYQAVLRGVEARFKDGTKLTVPDECTVNALELKSALSGESGRADLYLALPSFDPTRPNTERIASADGPRHLVQEISYRDEDTGTDTQDLEVLRPQARLLAGNQRPGYEYLPLARIVRSAERESPPSIDASYVPPLINLDAWPPLWREVQGLSYQIGGRIEQLAGQAAGRGISFESQVPGDAERLLKLWVLNGAYAYLQSVVFLKGIHPLTVYTELCRLAGQLAIFGAGRRGTALPPYDHENLGPCYARVIKEIRDRLDDIPAAAFEKRYFERAGEKLQVSMDKEWMNSNYRIYLGVETELSDEDCFKLLVGTQNRPGLDMKLGSARQVEEIFRRKVTGMRFIPTPRPPRQLPAGVGVVYFQVERTPVFWDDILNTLSLGLIIKRDHAAFKNDRIVTVTSPETQRSADMQFALFVYKDN